MRDEGALEKNKMVFLPCCAWCKPAGASRAAVLLRSVTHPRSCWAVDYVAVATPALEVPQSKLLICCKRAC